MGEPYEKSYESRRTRRGYYEQLNPFGDMLNENSWSLVDVNSGELIGSTNPEWRILQEGHVQAGTIMHAERDRIDKKALYLRQVFTYNNPKTYYVGEQISRGDYFIQGISSDLSSDPLVAEADNMAVTNYIRSANKARRVINGGELIGEWAELVRQVGNPGKSLRKGLDSYLRSVKKRAYGRKVRRLPAHRRARVQAKIISDTWLEASFGWRPTVGEISNVIKYIMETEPASRLAVREIRGIGRVEDSAWQQNSSAKFPINHGPPTQYVRQRNSARVIVVYRGQFGMHTNAVMNITEKQGIAPHDWIPTAWELVPYSFLSDYFANLGNIITALSFPKNQIRWTMRTIIRESKAVWTDPEYSWSDPYWGRTDRTSDSKQVLSSGAASRIVRTVDRAPYTGDLVPTLSFSIPSSGTQWLNMAALFAGSRYVQKLLGH